MSITVDEAAEVVVRCPLQTRVSEVESFLQAKSAWIARQQAVAAERLAHQRIAREDEVVWFGTVRKANRAPGLKQPVFNETHVAIPAHWSAARLDGHERALLSRMLEREVESAREDLMHLVPERTDWPSGAFRIRKMRRRWGSCGADGRLLFNARLIEAAPEAIRYVVRHELAHWMHFDHSKAFRALELALVGGSSRLAAAKAELARVALSRAGESATAGGEGDDLL